MMVMMGRHHHDWRYQASCHYLFQCHLSVLSTLDEPHTYQSGWLLSRQPYFREDDGAQIAYHNWHA
jgi:hypothetical protein